MEAEAQCATAPADAACAEAPVRICAPLRRLVRASTHLCRADCAADAAARRGRRRRGRGRGAGGREPGGRGEHAARGACPRLNPRLRPPRGARPHLRPAPLRCRRMRAARAALSARRAAGPKTQRQRAGDGGRGQPGRRGGRRRWRWRGGGCAACVTARRLALRQRAGRAARAAGPDQVRRKVAGARPPRSGAAAAREYHPPKRRVVPLAAARPPDAPARVAARADAGQRARAAGGRHRGCVSRCGGGCGDERGGRGAQRAACSGAAAQL